jgi:hypothetical protein
VYATGFLARGIFGQRDVTLDLRVALLLETQQDCLYKSWVISRMLLIRDPTDPFPGLLDALQKRKPRLPVKFSLDTSNVQNYPTCLSQGCFLDSLFQSSPRYPFNEADDCLQICARPRTYVVDVMFVRRPKRLKDSFDQIVNKNVVPNGALGIQQVNRLVKQSSSKKNRNHALLPYPGAYPRGFLVYSFRTASDYIEAQEILAQSNFDARSEVVIEDPTVGLDHVQGHPNTQSRSEIVAYEPNKVIVDVQTDSAAFLVLTDLYYPGWTAEIDGRPATIYRADGLFRAVKVEPGHHTIVFSYLPITFLAGVATSTLTAVGLAYHLVRRHTRTDGSRTRARVDGGTSHVG